jgi:hypothetical protein
MKNLKKLIVLSLFFPLINSCEKEIEINKEKPIIDLSILNAFPSNCDTLYFGESFNFKVKFSDNEELGSYSINIHDNFDHHSHSTEVTECSLGEIKNPVNPFTFIEDHNITPGTREMITDISIEIPEKNNNGLFDEGDYHFFISLTDKEGWSAQKGLSIKMLHR